MMRRNIRNSAFIVLFGLLATFAYSLHVVSRQQDLDRSLVQAIRFGDQDNSVTLIEAGADPNTWDPTAQEPLIKQFLDRLLHRPKPQRYGTPVLLLASMNGRSRVVHALLKHGATGVNCADSADKTPLFYEAVAGNLENVRLLLAEGARPDGCLNCEFTPLVKSIIDNGGAEIVQTLLDAGADPNKAIPEGSTPLIYAARFRRIDCVKLLLDHGAHINARGEYEGSALTVVAMSEERDNDTSESGRKTRHELMTLLLAGNADPNIDQHHGKTALCYAAQSGDYWAVDTLLKHGARTDVGLGYGTPLMTASYAGDVSIVNRLIAAGADVNLIRSKWDDTALHDAVSGGHLDVVRVLLKHGARQVANGHGVTPISIAVKAGRRDISELLQRYATIDGRNRIDYLSHEMHSQRIGGRQ